MAGACSNSHVCSPELHPFEAEREYQRALNAVKLEKVFAKPFISSLDGHRDGLTAVAKHPKVVSPTSHVLPTNVTMFQSLSTICSADASGELRIWNLTSRKCVSSWAGHNAVVRGADFTPSGTELMTVGDDKTIKVSLTKI